MKLKRAYLDYVATTPLHTLVFKKMKRFFASQFANPSALYQEALVVKKEVESAREKIAEMTGARSDEVIFTSGATESNNLAILGFIKSLPKEQKKKIIISMAEHSAISKVCENLKDSNLEIVSIGLDQKGNLKLDDLKKELDENVVLISVMLVNNEIGNIYPLREISSLVKKFKNQIGRGYHDYPFIHTDASQAVNFLDIHIDRLGVSMMSLDGSKFYGPKGSGVLIKKFFVPMQNILFGGNQEFGLRPGTLNVPNIIGFETALGLAMKNREKNYKKVLALQKYFVEKILSNLKEVKLIGNLENKIPGIVNVCFPKFNSEFLTIALDEKGVACSPMATCENMSDLAKSKVIEAIDPNCASSSIRFSLSHLTSKNEINLAIKSLKELLKISQN